MLPAGEFLAVWTLLAVNIASPGPNVLNTMVTAMGSGRRAGLASAAAVGFGIGGWCLGMSLGMSALFRLVPAAQVALTLVASGLLVWYAVRYIRAALRRGQGAGAPMAGLSGLTPRAAFLRSLAINATNPKALTTWIAILGLFPTAQAGTADIALLTAGASVLAVSLHAGYATAFSTAPAARAYLRLAPAIHLGVGLFFLGFAAKLTAPLAARALETLP